MVAAPEPDPNAATNPAEEAWLEDLIVRFEQAWKRSQRPDLDAYLSPDLAQRLQALRWLLPIDIKYRLQKGEKPRLEEYLERYPESAAETKTLLALIASEFSERRQFEADLQYEEYVRRFPHLEAALREMLAETRTIDTPSPLVTPSGSVRTTVRAGAEAAAGSGSDAAAELRYRAVAFHAAGNLGEIHKAQDVELGRTVALKRMKASQAAHESLRLRFLREAEITGRLEHPGIVPVYGLVHDSNGEPAYAMRFIEGETLTAAIRRFHAAEKPGRDPGERSLALRELLQRFIAVCRTMAYAHDRGVVHRDLKPDNIMLGKYGETLVVDWGLARASDTPASTPAAAQERQVAATMPMHDVGSQPGQLIGTPLYMSPEQAAAEGGEAQPASDIYTLGAILFELLSGQTPVARASLETVLSDIERGRLRLLRQVKPDMPRALEAICCKAMALAPADRYATALDLAADVEHWLADEPVTARPETSIERLSRWSRRHKQWLASGLVVLVVVVAGLIAGLVRQSQAKEKERELRHLAEQKEREATANAELARTQEQIAIANAEQAQRNAAEANQLSDFVQGVIVAVDPLGLEASAMPRSGDPTKITAQELLDRGSFKVINQFQGSPLVRAALCDRLGAAYAGLGIMDKAEWLVQQGAAIRRQEVGEDSAEYAASLHSMAVILHYHGQFVQAAEFFRKALELRRRHLGPDDLRVADTILHLAWVVSGQFGNPAKASSDEIEDLFRQGLRIRERVLGPEHRDTAVAKIGYGFYLYSRGKKDEAIKLIQQSLSVLAGKGIAERFFADYVDANFLLERGEHRKALTLIESLHQQVAGYLGETHLFTLLLLGEFAGSLRKYGQASKAELVIRRAIELGRKSPYKWHPRMLQGLEELADFGAKRHDFAEAIPLYAEAIGIADHNQDEEAKARLEAKRQAALKQQAAEAKPKP